MGKKNYEQLNNQCRDTQAIYYTSMTLISLTRGLFIVNLVLKKQVCNIFL